MDRDRERENKGKGLRRRREPRCHRPEAGRTGASTSTPVDARGALGLLGWQADRSARRAARRVVRPLPWTCHAPRGASRRGKSRRGTQAGKEQAKGRRQSEPGGRRRVPGDGVPRPRGARLALPFSGFPFAINFHRFLSVIVRLVPRLLSAASGA